MVQTMGQQQQPATLSSWFRPSIRNLVSSADGSNHGEIIVGYKPSYLGLYMHLFRDIKSVYSFITFKKNWWARKFNNISFLKHSKPYYIVCYLHVTPKHDSMHKTNMFFFLIRKTRYTLW